MSDLSKDIAQQVTAAFEEGKALNIIGGNTKSFTGRTGTGEPLHLKNHSGIISYDPVELVMRVRAGTSIEEIQTVLAENKQILACETPHYNGKATIGGSLASNQSGPARPWHGAIRDCVLGLNLVNGKGELLRFGGQVMKNVAGYDLSRLQAGAMGCFGVITEISLKVVPKPEFTLSVQREITAETAMDVFSTICQTNTLISAASWHNNRLKVRLSGEKNAVREAAKGLNGTLIEGEDFWQSTKEFLHPFFTKSQELPLWRFSINSATKHFKEDCPWFIDWGGSLRWLCGDFEQAELEQIAHESGGEVSLYRGGDREGEVFHSMAPAKKSIYKNLKKAFDPRGVFNPGRLYGWM